MKKLVCAAALLTVTGCGSFKTDPALIQREFKANVEAASGHWQNIEWSTCQPANGGDFHVRVDYIDGPVPERWAVGKSPYAKESGGAADLLVFRNNDFRPKISFCFDEHGNLVQTDFDGQGNTSWAYVSDGVLKQSNEAAHRAKQLLDAFRQAVYR